ncbi:MAG TPA: hypothetical protein VIH90_08540 [Candidatus Saccharimonadales bacterium]
MSNEQKLLFCRDGLEAEHCVGGLEVRLPLARVSALYSPFHYFVESQPDSTIRDIVLYCVFLSSLTEEFVKYEIDGNVSGVDIRMIRKKIVPSVEDIPAIQQRLEHIGGTDVMDPEQLLYVGAVANIHEATFRAMYGFDQAPSLATDIAAS